MGQFILFQYSFSSLVTSSICFISLDETLLKVYGLIPSFHFSENIYYTVTFVEELQQPLPSRPQ